MNKLAIVIPYYKLDFFEETLKSVAAQTDRNFTLYIGNDASQYDPLPLIQKHFSDNEFNYYHYSKNVGGTNLALQWERILENVTEEWFQILGDDDVISNNFVEEFYSNLPEIKRNKSNVVKVHHHIIDENNNIQHSGLIFSKTLNRMENWLSKFVDGKPASLTEHIFNMKSFRKIGFRHFPLAWGTDDTAIFEISGNYPIYFIEKSCAKVRVSNISISGNNSLMEEKKKAHYYFWQYIISIHYKEFEREYLYKMVNYQINFSYTHNLPLGLWLSKIYLYHCDFRRLLNLPKIYFYLYKRHAKHH